METYEEFLARIELFETRQMCLGTDGLKGNPSLKKKLNPDNTFRDFFGDTIVFNLDRKMKHRLAEWVDRLYMEVPECFCERLRTDTFHMTLHDLSSSGSLTNVVADVFVNELKVREKIKELQLVDTIRMKSKYIFNMADTSLVLGLLPVDAAEHEKLRELYQIFDEVKKLDYPLTPHVTLAYFNRLGFGAEAAKKLEQLVCELNAGELANPFEVRLEGKELFYQKFSSMNEYVNVLPIFDK